MPARGAPAHRLGAVLAVALAALAVAGCSGPAGEPPGPGPALRLLCAPCAAALPLPAGSAFEPSADADPADPLHAVVALKDGGGPFGLYETRDGGATWTRAPLAVGAAAPDGSFLAGIDTVGDPVVAFAPGGRLLVAGIGYQFEELPGGQLYRRTAASTFVAASPGGAGALDGGHVVAQGTGTAIGQRAANVGDVSPLTPDWTNHDKGWVVPDGDGAVEAWIRISPVLQAPESDPQRPLETNALLLSRAGPTLDGWSEPIELAVGQPGFPMPLPLGGGAILVTFTEGGEVRQSLVEGGRPGDASTVADAAGQSFLARRADGQVLLLANDRLDGGYRPTLRSGDGRGPWAVVWQAPASADFPNAALDLGPDGTAWVGWYATNGTTRDYRVAAIPPGGLALERTLATGLSASAAYGDYVGAVAAVPGGAIVAWPGYRAGADARTLESATLRLG
jgi:hypothetical protein